MGDRGQLTHDGGDVVTVMLLVLAPSLRGQAHERDTPRGGVVGTCGHELDGLLRMGNGHQRRRERLSQVGSKGGPRVLRGPRADGGPGWARAQAPACAPT